MIGHDKNGAVNAFNPFFNMWHRSHAGRARRGDYPQERITRQEALRMWTIWAAYLQFGEKTRGSIESGKFADLVVIDRDYLSCAEDGYPPHRANRDDRKRPVVSGRL
jgi:predicted amidohydrolase YtcJ